MTYALVIDNTIRSLGSLPRSARRLDNGAWVLGLREYGTVETQQACGYFAVVDTVKPADTATTTHERSVELLDGTPTVVWTERAKTPDELASETAKRNDSTVRQQAEAALVDLRTIAQSSGTLTGAQLSNAVRVIARACIGLIRLQLGKLDATD